MGGGGPLQRRGVLTQKKQKAVKQMRVAAFSGLGTLNSGAAAAAAAPAGAAIAGPHTRLPTVNTDAKTATPEEGIARKLNRANTGVGSRYCRDQRSHAGGR